MRKKHVEYAEDDMVSDIMDTCGGAKKLLMSDVLYYPYVVIMAITAGGRTVKTHTYIYY